MINSNSNINNISEELRHLIIGELSEDKADDILSIDLSGKTDLADYMIIATGRSNKHLISMAEKLADKLTKNGYGIITPEGKSQSNWILIDVYDIIIHLFTKEERELYKIEELWNYK